MRYTVLYGIMFIVERDAPLLVKWEEGGHNAMPLYMTQFAYTPEAWAVLIDSPEDRSAPVRELTESMGGRLIGWYLSMGDYDGLLIYEAPDDATAGAAVLAAARRGHLRATKTTPLFSAEEGMEIMRRAGGTAFRAPGQ
jgi:uncharacterized protein with GYD domain